MSKFGGLGVAMVTPFNEKGQIDFAGVERLVEHMIDGGVDYLVVQGTTGESPSLGIEEKRSLLDFIIEITKKRVPIVYGLGGNNTRVICDLLRSMDWTGVSGVLSVCPFYNKPSQAGMIEHYKQVANASPVPVILYNVPGRTGVNLSAVSTLELAKIDNIVAIKEASGDLNQIGEILLKKPADFQVISGDDALTLPLIAMGAEGVISVVGNAFPKIFSQMVNQALFGQVNEARVYHYQLLELMNLLFVEGSPAGIKEALKHRGICENHLRLPLLPVSASTSEAIYRQMAEHDLVEV
jgi:4-hydroxy-tetrahydrodipicolinate synthase